MLEELQIKIHYQFKDKDLLKLALTHRSCSRQNNERLEFLGDSLLGTIIAEILFLEFPQESEGILTKARSCLVKEETLSKIASELELSTCLILGLGEQISGGSQKASILADAVESLIAGIYLDCGKDYNTTFDIVHSLFEAHIKDLQSNEDFIDNANLQNYKSILQELLQAKAFKTPEYKVIKQEGPDHKKHFVVQATLSSFPNQEFIGEGFRKKCAEQQAAKAVLDFFGKQ